MNINHQVNIEGTDATRLSSIGINAASAGRVRGRVQENASVTKVARVEEA